MFPRSSDVSSLLVAARGERWSTAEGGRLFHAWQLEEVRRAAVQASAVEEEMAEKTKTIKDNLRNIELSNDSCHMLSHGQEQKMCTFKIN